MGQKSLIGVRFAPGKVRLLKTIISLKEKEGGDYINELDRR